MMHISFFFFKKVLTILIFCTKHVQVWFGMLFPFNCRLPKGVGYDSLKKIRPDKTTFSVNKDCSIPWDPPLCSFLAKTKYHLTPGVGLGIGVRCQS